MTGQGKGYTVNFPMSAGWGDEEYLRAFNEVLVPVARKFQPQLILVSVGFDLHWADSIAMMQASVTGFAQIVRILKKLAVELCQGHLAFTLEGGYNLQVAALGTKAIFDVLLGTAGVVDPLGKAPVIRKAVDFEEHLKRIKGIHHIENQD
jgi:acetoin utilization deacetylase AcuC-like enzyme